MKTLMIVLIGILLLGVFTFTYGFILNNLNYGVMDYDEYYGIGNYNQTPCEAKHLKDGWTQLSNCAIYKVNQTKFRRIIK